MSQTIGCSRLILYLQPITSITYTKARTRCSFFIKWFTIPPSKATQHPNSCIRYGAVIQYYLLRSSSPALVDRVALIQEYIYMPDVLADSRGYQHVSKGDLMVITVEQILSNVIMFPSSTTTPAPITILQSTSHILSQFSFTNHHHLPQEGNIVDIYRKPQHSA
jgi:hypothetical protein